MRELIVKIGKDFCSDNWSVAFGNRSDNFSFPLLEGFKETIPFPGAILNENDIKIFIEFLQNTLKEKEENEQSNMG